MCLCACVHVIQQLLGTKRFFSIEWILPDKCTALWKEIDFESKLAFVGKDVIDEDSSQWRCEEGKTTGRGVSERTQLVGDLCKQAVKSNISSQSWICFINMVIFFIFPQPFSTFRCNHDNKRGPQVTKKSSYFNIRYRFGISLFIFFEVNRRLTRRRKPAGERLEKYCIKWINSYNLTKHSLWLSYLDIWGKIIFTFFY